MLKETDKGDRLKGERESYSTMKIKPGYPYGIM